MWRRDGEKSLEYLLDCGDVLFLTVLQEKASEKRLESNSSPQALKIMSMFIDYIYIQINHTHTHAHVCIYIHMIFARFG